MAPFSDHTWPKPCAWLTFVHQPNFWQGALMGKHNFIKTQNHNSDSIATSCAGGNFWWMESHITLIPFTWILMSPTKLKALNHASEAIQWRNRPLCIMYQFNPFFNISPNLVALPNKPLEKILKCILLFNASLARVILRKISFNIQNLKITTQTKKAKY